jgi:hypothetical protein
MSETAISRAIRETLALHGVHVARNNTGRLQDRNGRWVTFGLGLGSADLIGCVNGRYFALEVKTATGRQTPEQVAWANARRKEGAFVAVVRSAEEAIAAVNRCRDGASE